MRKSNTLNAKYITTVAMLCAIAFIATAVSKVFPKVEGFLSFDLKDTIVVIGGFIMGPLPAMLITMIVSLIEMLTISTTGPIGLIMNILSSCSFACMAAAVYSRRRSVKNALIGLICGVLCMTVTMLLWNWLVTPLYMKIPRSVVQGMLLTVFLPFNLVKGGINAALSFILYKPIVGALRKAALIPQRDSEGNSRIHVGWLAVALIVLVSLVLTALVLTGIL